MFFLIDFHGTVVGNESVPESEWRRVLPLLRALHPVTVWSGDPGGIPLVWRTLFDCWDIKLADKGCFMTTQLRDAVVIDDQTSILTMAARAGAITVPAEQAATFFGLMELC